MARVLVVDDEPQIRAILRAYLSAEGFQVQEAATGAQALHLLATEPPDLVLLDIGLPDLDGLEVLRTLRKTSDTYVVLVTARAEEVDKLIGLGVGADDYVTKPFSPREIVARVKAVALLERLQRLGGQVGRMPTRQDTVAPSPWGADDIDDDCVWHGGLPMVVIVAG